MSLPYFKLYPHDFDGGAPHLTIEEDGAYNRLLRLQWKLGGSIPADEAQLMRLLRCNKPTFKRAVKPVLEEFFEQEENVFFNKRLRKEQEISENSHKKRVESGRKGGEKKSAKTLKTIETTSSNAKAMLKQPEPEPEPEPYITSLPSARERATEFEKLCEHLGYPNFQVKGGDLLRRWLNDLSLTFPEIEEEVLRVKDRFDAQGKAPPRNLTYFNEIMQERAGRKTQKLEPVSGAVAQPPVQRSAASILREKLEADQNKKAEAS